MCYLFPAGGFTFAILYHQLGSSSVQEALLNHGIQGNMYSSWSAFLNAAPNQAQAMFGTSQTTCGGQSTVIPTSTPSVLVGHISADYSSWSFYLNGVSISTSPFLPCAATGGPPAPSSPGSSLHIGPSSNAMALPGHIYEVVVWKGVSFNASTIASLQVRVRHSFLLRLFSTNTCCFKPVACSLL